MKINTGQAWESRWNIIKELGEGGQGKVYKVIDVTKFNLEQEIKPAINNWINSLSNRSVASTPENFDLFRKAIVKLVKMDDDANHSALKILHKAEKARDAESAEARIKHEMQAMSEMHHPNLLKIIDADPNGKWFVSEYHPKGTIDRNGSFFVGDFPRSLRAFRRLVAGVSELHKNKIIHRDIKPQNIFIDSTENLILGDFGLVFYSDEKHTRLSNTFENVGSRDWMPAWAMGMRVEDISPAFDVFSLGKVLWSMVSGLPILRLWYFERAQFNLESIFPGNRFIKFANPLLKKCIVEEAKDCLSDASELLEEVDTTLSVIDAGADVIRSNDERTCKVCGIGSYELIVDQGNITAVRNFGFSPTGSKTMKIFVCSHCGNVQMFAFGDGRNPVAWNKE